MGLKAQHELQICKVELGCLFNRKISRADLGDVLAEGAATDVLAVEEDVDSVVTRSQSLVGNVVGTIAFVLQVNSRELTRRSADVDLEVFSTESLVGASLVDRTNGEVEVLDEGISGPCSRLDVDVVGGSLDWLSVESNGNVVTTGILGLVDARVGTITVVLDIARNRSGRSGDLNLERITPLLHVVAVFVLGLDGEVGREGIEVTGFKTRTEGKRLRGICSWLNVDDNR